MSVAQKIAILLVVVGALLLPVQSFSEDAASTYVLTGRVVDATTGTAIPGAEVMLFPGSSKQLNGQTDDEKFFVLQNAIVAQLADAAGRFSFSGLEPGSYVLAGEARGFCKARYQQHDSFITGIVIGEGSTPQEYVLSLIPAASLAGTITDDEGEPVEGAEVSLFRDSNNRGPRSRSLVEAGRSMTDDNGRYEYHHLMPGTYYLRVTADPWYTTDPTILRDSYDENGPPSLPSIVSKHGALDVGYAWTYSGGTTNPYEALPIVLRPGGRGSEDITLQAVPMVTASVHPGPEDGCPDLAVVFVRPSLGNEIETYVPRCTDSKVLEGDVIPGLYTMHYFLGEGRYYTKVVELFVDTEIYAPAVMPAPSISGVVEYERSSQAGRSPVIVPDQSALVFRNHASGENIEVWPAEQGEFDFTKIPNGNIPLSPGVYDLDFFIVGGKHVPISKVTVTGAEVDGLTIRITDEKPVHIAVTLSERSEKVHGIAMDHGKPLSGAFVMIVPEDPAHHFASFHYDQSNSDGSFTLEDALPGKYKVVAIENGWEFVNASAINPYPLLSAIVLSRGTQVEISADKSANVVVQGQRR